LEFNLSPGNSFVADLIVDIQRIMSRQYWPEAINEVLCKSMKSVAIKSCGKDSSASTSDTILEVLAGIDFE